MRGAGFILLCGCALAACGTDTGGPSGAAAPDEPPSSFADTPGAVTLRAASVDSRELDYPALRECGVVQAGSWTARIEEAPGARDKAVRIEGVAGTNPSVEFDFVLDSDIMESNPVQRRARMIVTHPEGANIDRLDRYDLEARLPYSGDLGILRLECGGVLMATITDPAEAQVR
ncbi:hypothetical protein WJS89_09840 [Sphingomicrobium sp. XHP0235]|uniref:hypothetical protein n=1 Tax=Sphingomicrobium aquimarinum TaxID=3133971 RepID=UPI0031FE9A52